MLGPVVGVAAMVGAVGLTESAKGDLKQKLATLGTTLITVQAGGTFGQQNPTLPTDAVHRVQAVPTVPSGVGGRRGRRRADAAERGLREVLRGVPGAGARRRRLAAERARGADAERALAARRRRPQPHTRAGHGRGAGQGVRRDPRRDPHAPPQRGATTASSACSNRVALDPNLDNAVFVTAVVRQARLRDRRASRRSCTSARSRARRRPRPTRSPTAINLGGTESVTTKIPSDALEASAQADKTLQQTALFAGILALAVGGLGIANVMSISVIQRSSEIGIRRALGNTRSVIALQFLLEALFVGILGGLLGAVLGVGDRVPRVLDRGLGRGDRLRPDAVVDRARRDGLGARRALPVGQGRPARAARDAPAGVEGLPARPGCTPALRLTGSSAHR